MSFGNVTTINRVYNHDKCPDDIYSFPRKYMTFIRDIQKYIVW